MENDKEPGQPDQVFTSADRIRQLNDVDKVKRKETLRRGERASRPIFKNKDTPTLTHCCISRTSQN